MRPLTLFTACFLQLVPLAGFTVETAQAQADSVPADLGGRPVLVLDPMLATGGSLAFACSLLQGRNPGRVTAVCVLAAPEGVRRIDASGLVDDLVVAAIDERLNDVAYIVPGLGDAGDRLFGTA